MTFSREQHDANYRIQYNNVSILNSAQACMHRYQADGRMDMLHDLLPGLVNNFKAWKASSYVEEEACFFSGDTADGGEDSISGDGCRVSINAIMVGPHAAALSHRPAFLQALTSGERLYLLSGMHCCTKCKSISALAHDFLSYRRLRWPKC